MMLHFVEATHQIKRNGVNYGNQSVKVKEHKKLLSVEANAVVHPRAMVIHKSNAVTTVFTMVSSRRLN